MPPCLALSLSDPIPYIYATSPPEEVTMPKLCHECEDEISKSKKWGYATLCSDCDQPESTSRSMGILIADGKTDYHFQVIKNPSPRDVENIRSIGRAWDPRSQLKSINKVSD
jgi:hypothetical protein